MEGVTRERIYALWSAGLTSFALSAAGGRVRARGPGAVVVDSSLGTRSRLLVCGRAPYGGGTRDGRRVGVRRRSAGLSPSWRCIPRGLGAGTAKAYARRCGVGLVLTGLSLGIGCGLSPGDSLPQTSRPFAPVYLLDTEFLESPVVARPGVFKPVALSDLDANDPSTGRFAAFFVTLATRDPVALKLRLHDQVSASQTALRLAASPTGAEREVASQPGPFNAATRAWLAEGDGVYWHANAGETAEGLSDRFAVLIPEQLLSPLAKLEMYTDVAGDGSVVGAAWIELVREFFYMATIGDSLLWGNGLRERDKITTLVAATIEQETQRKVIPQRYARSGARIVPAEGDSVDPLNWISEVPTASTSIMAQADLIQQPELVELILLDGCSNDIGNFKILDPATEEDDLIELTRQFCGDELTNLLRKVRGIAPQAHIVVPGFIQTVSAESDSFVLEQWVIAQQIDPDEDEEELRWEIAKQSLLVRDTAHESIQQAIETVTAELGGEPMIAFADPSFGPENALSAEHAWVWGFTSENDLFETLSLDMAIFPEDPMSSYRLANCFDPVVIPNIIECLYLSVAHPNPEGARAFADAITAALRALGVLPAAPPGS